MSALCLILEKLEWDVNTGKSRRNLKRHIMTILKMSWTMTLMTSEIFQKIFIALIGKIHPGPNIDSAPGEKLKDEMT